MLPLRDSIPGRTTPYVTVGLIVANFLVWFWELKNPGVDVHVFRDGFYPCAVDGPCHLPPGFHALPWYEGVFTGMFMHAGWEHILGNMLFLWIFGNNVEDAFGHVAFFFWYLVAGVMAMATQTFVTLEYAGVGAASIPNIGASGAIAGVLGTYFVLYPRARVLTFDLHHHPGDPGLLVPRHLVRAAGMDGRPRPGAPGERGRSCVLRPHRRVRVRGVERPVPPPSKAELTSISPPLTLRIRVECLEHAAR
jgi:membrane associated rhomboid family serine protease